jgi:uncharacterized protein (TIGR00255 family)
MTGFGSGRASAGGEEVSVEIKSVNHKFCEVKARLPKELASLEPVALKQVKDRLARGAVDLVVKRQARPGLGLTPTIDVPLAKEYRRAFADLAEALGLSQDVTLRDIVQQPNVVRLEELQVSLDDALPAMEKALRAALDALGAMRAREGAALEFDVRQRLRLVADHVAAIGRLAPRAVEDHRARLTERVAELAQGANVDPQRLMQEVVLFAERTDVAEEMTRLASHLAQLDDLLASPEPAGRKMDFLVQEMHREVNTTGSKSQHHEISAHVVQLKAELERIREQVQNIE